MKRFGPGCGSAAKRVVANASAPVKKWLELEEENIVETEEGKNRECENTKDDKETVGKKKDLRSLIEEERDVVNTVVMSYDTNYYKFSVHIAKETWAVGGIQDPLFRSRGWKK
ncbi:hypothetical protein Bca101_054270 [Brassica carinata]